MGQNMGQKCGLAMGQPNKQLSPPNLDLRHIQDHFEFTFPRVALTGFSRVFSNPVFEPSADAGRFSSSAGNLPPVPTWVINMGQAVFPHPEAENMSHPKVS